MMVTQRMCMAVSPWTMLLIAWLNCIQRRNRLEKKQAFRMNKPTYKAIEKSFAPENIEPKMTAAEVLSVKNLPLLLPPKKNIEHSKEDPINYHHTIKLIFIWCLSLVCGLCSEQALEESDSIPCSLTRSLHYPVEIASILLTYPIPAFLTLCPYVVSLRYSVSSKFSSFHINPITHHFTSCAKTSLLLSICYLLSIMPSLLVELVDMGSNVALLMVVKFSLASLHIIYEPLIILYMRPAL